MAREQHSTSPTSMTSAVPLLVVVLLAAHVLALVYWIYRLATEKPPLRRKSH